MAHRGESFRCRPITEPQNVFPCRIQELPPVMRMIDFVGGNFPSARVETTASPGPLETAPKYRHSLPLVEREGNRAGCRWKFRGSCY